MPGDGHRNAEDAKQRTDEGAEVEQLGEGQQPGLLLVVRLLAHRVLLTARP